jgi:hypothetical protein
VLVDNRAADLGTYSNTDLLDLLRALNDDYEGSGFVSEDMSDLIAQVEEMLPPITTGLDAPGVGDDSSPAPEPRLGDDGLIRSNDLVTDRDAYEDKATRLVVMALPIAQFVWAQEKLADYRREKGLETNSEVLLEVLAAYSGETPPAADAIAAEEV